MNSAVEQAKEEIRIIFRKSLSDNGLKIVFIYSFMCKFPVIRKVNVYLICFWTKRGTSRPVCNISNVFLFDTLICAIRTQNEK